MPRLATITFALTFALSLVLLPVQGLPVRALLNGHCTNEVQGSCIDAKANCDVIVGGGDSDTNLISCHAGSTAATSVYECADGCTGTISAIDECEQLPIGEPIFRAVKGYAVLAGATVTNTVVAGGTVVTGNLGVSPGTAVTNFPPGVVIGNIDSANGASGAGTFALTASYNDVAGRTFPAGACINTKIGNLGGDTLTPGLYKSTGVMEVSGQKLVLDAEWDTEAMFFFQMATTFTMAEGMHIELARGAKASNIFWQVGSSGMLNAATVFQGTMMADQAIVLKKGAVVHGRVLARIAAITLDENTITLP